MQLGGLLLIEDEAPGGKALCAWPAGRPTLVPPGPRQVPVPSHAGALPTTCSFIRSQLVTLWFGSGYFWRRGKVLLSRR